MADGHLRPIGSRHRTVDVAGIKEPFKWLGVKANWPDFDELSTVRNDVEHYYDTLNQESLNGVIVLAFPLAKSFLEDELHENPREVLGQTTWEALLQAQRFYDPERHRCDSVLAAVAWGSEALQSGIAAVRCPS